MRLLVLGRCYDLESPLRTHTWLAGKRVRERYSRLVLLMNGELMMISSAWSCIAGQSRCFLDRCAIKSAIVIVLTSLMRSLHSSIE